MYLVEDNDVFKRERETEFTNKETITFKHPTPQVYEKADYDWYITVVLEKANEVKVGRHLLTAQLLLKYRWAIREGYQQQLDPNLRRQYDRPRNKNTIAGIQGYIAGIEKKSNQQ